MINELKKRYDGKCIGEIVRLKEKIREKDKQIAAQARQIRRLKATLEGYIIIHGHLHPADIPRPTDATSFVD